MITFFPRLMRQALVVIALCAATASGVVHEYRCYRFVPLENRERTWKADGTKLIQLAEFQFYLGNVPISPAAATVTSTSANSPAGEEPAKASDGNVATKWLNLDYTPGAPLIFDFVTPRQVDGYNFITGNDHPERDPVSWRLEGGSAPAGPWKVLDHITRHPGTGNRNVAAKAGPFVLPVAPTPIIREFRFANPEQSRIVRNGTSVRVFIKTELAETVTVRRSFSGTSTTVSGSAEGVEVELEPYTNGTTLFELTAANGNVSTKAELTVRSVPHSPATYRYVRFEPMRTRGGGPAIQLADFEFSSDGQEVVPTAVTNPGGTNSPGSLEGVRKLIDAHDFQNYPPVNPSPTIWSGGNLAPVVFDFGSPRTFDAYAFVTAGFSPDRDPLEWVLAGSNDNLSWTRIESIGRDDIATPGERFRRHGVIPLPGTLLAPTIERFHASPNLVKAGDPVDLNWDIVGNGWSVAVNSGPGFDVYYLWSEAQVYPAVDTNYALDCWRWGSSSISARAEVPVRVIDTRGGTLSYANFDEAGDLFPVGHAKVVSDAVRFPQRGTAKCLRLTDFANDQTGAAWHGAKLDLADGFVTEFTASPASPVFINGADGMSFIVQNQGVAAIPSGELFLNSEALSVVLDSFPNEAGQSSARVEVRAGATRIAQADLVALGLARGASGQYLTTSPYAAPYRVRIAYVPGDLDVHVDGVAVIQNVAVNLETLGAVDESGQGYTGFAARTGLLSQCHDILSWKLIPAGRPDPDAFPPIAPRSSFTGGGGSGMELGGHAITYLPAGDEGFHYFTRSIDRLPDTLEGQEWEYLPYPGSGLRGLAIPLEGHLFPFFGSSYEEVIVTRDGAIEIGPGGRIDFCWSEFGGDTDLARYSRRADKLVIEAMRSWDGNGIAQIELFYDGWIRISYEDGDSRHSSMVGISRGRDSWREALPQADLGTATLTIACPSVLEGSPLAGTVTLGRTFPLDTPVAVSSRNGTALAGSDYTALQTIVTIPAGALSASFTIATLNDGGDETDESLYLRAAHPENPDWVYSECEVSLADDDARTTAPGRAPGSTPVVQRSGVLVYITPTGAGTTAFRLLSVSGGTLSWPGGGVIAPGAIISLAQGQAGLRTSGPDVRFVIEAIVSTGGAVIGRTAFDVDGSSNGEGTIFEFERGVVEVEEGQMARLAVTVDGSGEAIGYEIIPGSATAYDGTTGDYLPAIQPLRFDKNRRGIIEIPVYSDGISEIGDYFQVRLIGGTGDSYLGPESMARVNVTDGEGPVRLPHAAAAAGPRAVEEFFWPGEPEWGEIGFLAGYPGINAPINSGTSGATTNIPIPEQAGVFLLSFKVETPDATTDAVIGLSQSPAGAYGDMSAMVRASLPNGEVPGDWDAYDKASGGYRAERVIPYNAEGERKVWMRVDVPAKKYQVRIGYSDDSYSEALALFDVPSTESIEERGSFRADASVLRYLSIKREQGAVIVSDIQVMPVEKTIAFQPQTTDFSIEFETCISGSAGGPPKFIVGISGSASTLEQDMSALVGLNYDDEDRYSMPWMAWSGGSGGQWILNEDMRFRRGEEYRIKIDVFPASQSYRVYITPEEGPNLGEDGEDEGDGWEETREIFAGSGTFRKTAASLGYLHILSDEVTYRLSDLQRPPDPRIATTTANAGSSDIYWINLPIPTQTGKFSLSYDVQTLDAVEDSLCGLSSSPADNFPEVQVPVRMKGGRWEGWVGGTAQWGATNDTGYQPGAVYQVTLDVDVAANTYTAKVRPPGAYPVMVMSQGVFRTAATQLRYLSLRSVQGRIAITRIGDITAHASNVHQHTVGKITSQFGTGSGVAVADHAVLTSARLVFNPATLSYAPDIEWRFRIYPRTPTAGYLVTSYAAESLRAYPAGDDFGDSSDIAVLSFRPQQVPELDNAPALGGYSGFLIHPDPDSPANPLLESPVSRIVSYFPAATIPLDFNGPLPQVADLGSSSLAFEGHGVFSCSGLSLTAGAKGAALFSKDGDGHYYPSAICLGEGAGTPRFRVIDSLVAHTIHQANLVQQIYDPGGGLILGGAGWDPDAVTDAILKTYGVISGENLPTNMSWEVIPLGGESWSESKHKAKGGNVLILSPQYYRVKLGDAEGYAEPSPNNYKVQVKAGETYLLDPDSYVPLPTFTSWASARYTSAEMSSAAAAPEGTTWLGIDNLTAYAFGFDQPTDELRTADPEAGTPGWPRVTVDTTTVPPVFQVDFLQRNVGDLEYTVEFSDSLTGPWTTWEVAPTLEPVGSGAEWKHASLSAAPMPGAARKKFVRVKVRME